MKLTQLSPNIGAEITGIDLREPVDGETRRFLNAAVVDNVALVIRDQDFTPEQYAALVKLTATLCKVFPKLRCDYPRSADGKLITSKLPDDDLNQYQGILGHYHVQTNKVDPGPAFQWERVIGEARKLLK